MFLYDTPNYHELLKYHSYNDGTLTADDTPETQVTSADPIVRSSLAVSSQKYSRFPVHESILQLQVFYDQGRLCTFEEHIPKMTLGRGGGSLLNTIFCLWISLQMKVKYQTYTARQQPVKIWARSTVFSEPWTAYTSDIFKPDGINLKDFLLARGIRPGH